MLLKLSRSSRRGSNGEGEANPSYDALYGNVRSLSFIISASHKRFFFFLVKE